MLRPALLVTSLFVLLAELAPAQYVAFSETWGGDLSNSPANPTAIDLDFPGPVLITATQRGAAFGRDIDCFTFAVPFGAELATLRVAAYSSAPGNPAFIGLGAGSSLAIDPNAPDLSLLLGGATYGAADVGTDILPRMATLAGAQGFTPPLPTGAYTVWLDQSADPSTVTLELGVRVLGLGVEYCHFAIPNPTGVPGRVEGLGTTSVNANAFRVRGYDLPPVSFGYLLVADEPAATYGTTGNGRYLCLTGAIGRFTSQVQSSGAAGEITTVVDLNALPQPIGTVAVAPGQTWYFQVWHREPGPGGFADRNFTTALAVSFVP
jgi:hypothetical protein